MVVIYGGQRLTVLLPNSSHLIMQVNFMVASALVCWGLSCGSIFDTVGKELTAHFKFKATPLLEEVAVKIAALLPQDRKLRFLEGMVAFGDELVALHLTACFLIDVLDLLHMHISEKLRNVCLFIQPSTNKNTDASTIPLHCDRTIPWTLLNSKTLFPGLSLVLQSLSALRNLLGQE